MEMQVVTTLSNQKSLCIGQITMAEAESVMVDDPAFDGFGLYLVAVDARTPAAPGSVLAKFASEDAARTLAQFFRLHGTLEPA